MAEEELTKLAKTDPKKVKDVLWGGYIHPSGIFIELKDGMHYMNHGQPAMLGGVCILMHFVIAYDRCPIVALACMVVKAIHQCPSRRSQPWSDKPEEEETFALRDIKAGEEIFEDYTVYTGE